MRKMIPADPRMIMGGMDAVALWTRAADQQAFVRPENLK